jgi:YD repeat-containing protein
MCWRKRWYILFACVYAFILGASSLFAESILIDVEDHDASGPVKEVIETQAGFEEFHGKRRQSTISVVRKIMFNRQGKKTSEVMYSGGNWTQDVYYIYDDAGVLKEIRYLGSSWEKFQRFDETGKMIEEIRNDTKNDWILESWIETKEKNGSTIEYKSYYSDGRIARNEITSFDRTGKVTEKLHDPRGEDFRRWEYDYDVAGNLVQGKYFDKSYIPKDSWGSAYDERGNLTEVRHSYKPYKDRVHLQDKDILHSIRTYFFDEQDRLTRQLVRRYSQNGDLEYVFSYSYDIRGNIIEELYQHREDGFSTRWSYGYDSMNERTRETFYHSGGEVFTGYLVTNEYDAEGRLVDTIRCDLSGSQQSRTSHTYNGHGHLIESATYNPDNSLNSKTTYEYTYDEWGNWVERRTLTSNNLREAYSIPTLVDFRRISYYE